MAENARRTRRTRRPDIVDVEVEVDVDVDDDDADVGVDVPVQPVSRRRSAAAKKSPTSVEDEDDDFMPAKRAARRKVVKAEIDDDNDDSADDMGNLVVAQTYDGNNLFGSLVPGTTYTITAHGDNTYTVIAGAAQPVVATRKKSTGLRGAAFLDEVLSDEYKSWSEEWQGMTVAERQRWAKKLKAEWEQHDHELTNNMRMAMAVQNKLGIDKYKPEYSTRAAREALQNG